MILSYRFLITDPLVNLIYLTPSTSAPPPFPHYLEDRRCTVKKCRCWLWHFFFQSRTMKTKARISISHRRGGAAGGTETGEEWRPHGTERSAKRRTTHSFPKARKVHDEVELWLIGVSGSLVIFAALIPTRQSKCSELYAGETQKHGGKRKKYVLYGCDDVGGLVILKACICLFKGQIREHQETQPIPVLSSLLHSRPPNRRQGTV